MGSPRKKRTRLATGIYQDKFGISIVVRGKEGGNRWPLGTPLGDLVRERKRLIGEAGPTIARQGTLEADVATYLATLPADITTGVDRRRRRSDAARLLARWLAATTVQDGQAVRFSQLPRAAITSVMIRTQLASWRSEGLAESTCDHHRRELGTLYNVLNGKEGYNPVRAVPKFKPRYDDPRGFDLGALDTILESMPDRGKAPKGSRKKDGTLPTVNTAKLRLRVMRHCGIPPRTLARLTPSDIDIARATLRLPPRRKGEGAKGRLVPITAAAAAALRDFARHKLFGWFDQSSVNRAFTRAAKRYVLSWSKDHPDESCPVPDDVHAYDLRHAFLSDFFRRTADRKSTAYVAGHADNSAMTDRYLQAAVSEVVRKAVAVVNDANKPKT